MGQFVRMKDINSESVGVLLYILTLLLAVWDLYCWAGKLIVSVHT